MTPAGITELPQGLPADDLAQLMRWARVLVFVGAFLLAWITLEPYADLGSTASLEFAFGQEGTAYAAYGIMAAVAGAVALLTQPRALATLLHPLWIALGAWLSLTVVTSADVSLSLRRLILFGMLAVLTAALFLMPKGRRDLAGLLAAAVGVLVVLSLVGVALFPQFSIHQITDINEPQLAGDWRGVFAHKNTAGAIFAMTIFMMIYAIRTGLVPLGSVLLLLCSVFVLMSGAKSSTMLLVVSLAVSLVVARTRRGWLAGAIAFAPLVVLLVLGPGTVISKGLGDVIRLLPIDATFTGRADVWELALDKIGERPLTGFGYSAYWALESTRFGQEDTTQWGGHAAHAHNGYIDAALNMGMPGLLLVVAVFVVWPLRNFLAARAKGADPALLLMLLQIWLFGIYVSVLESFLFVRFDPIWITFLFAVFGLHYLARRPHVAE
ncbi:MAG: O-antigen ligase family protein [Phreatobacter sp.]|uniref:O-antigen ligase family protein n=1 Tax=Phreatobacter sp. TaxID=1966341 RepID=UPI004036CCDD